MSAAGARVLVHCREGLRFHANATTQKIIINNSFACVLSFYVGGFALLGAF